MTRRLLELAGVPALLLLASACGQAQSPADDAPAPGVRSEPDNAASMQDFSGVWMAFLVENPDRGGSGAGAGFGSPPQYTAEGQAALDAFVAQYREIPEPGGNCVGTGMPGVMLSTVSYPIEIIQNESRMIMIAELETQVRRIFTDGRDYPANSFPQMVGHSLGRWEGDALVIETEMLEPWELRPWPRTDDTRIVERVHRTTLDQIDARPAGFVSELNAAINDDVLVFDITITDPFYYEGPQRRIAYYQRVADEATAEYACIAGLWRDLLEEERIE